MLLLHIFAYGFALWLGLYLLARNSNSPPLRYAAAGLLLYALALAAETVGRVASPPAAMTIARFGRPLFFLPALFWFAAVLTLLPESEERRPFLSRWLDLLLPLAALLVYLPVALTDLIFLPAADALQPGPAYGPFAAVVAALLLAALLLAGRAWRRAPDCPRRRPWGHMWGHIRGLLFVATLFFGLGTGLLLIPFGWPPQSWLYLLISVDLLLFGAGAALFDAFAEGEAFLPDFLRSLDYAFFTALLFGGQVGLVMWLSTGVTLPLVTLLLMTIATAVAVQTWAAPLQAWLDRIALARFPSLRQLRGRLRTESNAALRLDDALDPQEMPEEEFNRLTRRAFSHLGNLPKLASSPLTRLVLVEERLAARDAAPTTLERAAALRAILIESVERMKPRGQGDFGATDEWRHYNALYFPYVAGLRPYSRRASHTDLNEAESKALDWFRTQVPERTLYNWQQAAARLVARELRDRARIQRKQVH